MIFSLSRVVFSPEKRQITRIFTYFNSFTRSFLFPAVSDYAYFINFLFFSRSLFPKSTKPRVFILIFSFSRVVYSPDRSEPRTTMYFKPSDRINSKTKDRRKPFILSITSRSVFRDMRRALSRLQAAPVRCLP